MTYSIDVDTLNRSFRHWKWKSSDLEFSKIEVTFVAFVLGKFAKLKMTNALIKADSRVSKLMTVRLSRLMKGRKNGGLKEGRTIIMNLPILQFRGHILQRREFQKRICTAQIRICKNSLYKTSMIIIYSFIEWIEARKEHWAFHVLRLK